MKRFVTTLVFAAVFFSGCVKEKLPDANVKSPDYLSLQKAAERFSPAVGVYGGEIVLSTLSEPVSFNPITATDPASKFMTSIGSLRLPKGV